MPRRHYSKVFITYHTENVSDFDKTTNDFTSNKRVYRSKFRSMVKHERQMRHVMDLGNNKKLVTSSAKSYCQTMGHAATPLDPPCKFLRKRQGIKWKRLNEHKCPPKRNIPPVPRFPHTCSNPVKEVIKHPDGYRGNQKELPTKTVCRPKPRITNKNFIKLNIEKAKKTPTKRPPPYYVDTPKGERHNVINSGIVPQYICSKNFGKVPCYISARRNLMEKAEDICSDGGVPGGRRHARYLKQLEEMRRLSDEERNKIVAVSANKIVLF